MSADRIYLRPGDRVRLEMPFSEVCMHMRVAGTAMDVELLSGDRGNAGRPWFAVQLYRPGEPCPFSLPITPGEAGIFTCADGSHYAYGPESQS